MKPLNFIMAGFIIFIMISSSQAFADFIDNGDYTTDTEANLDWLDMSYTDSKSYNEVLALLDSDLSGWRFATSEEFDTLATNYLGYEPTPYFAPENSYLNNLVYLMGRTYGDGGYASMVVGYVDSSDLSYALAREMGYSMGSGGFFRPEDHDWDRDKNAIDGNIGAFLVRVSDPSLNQISEPSNLLLMLFGFFGIIGLIRKKLS